MEQQTDPTDCRDARQPRPGKALSLKRCLLLGAVILFATAYSVFPQIPSAPSSSSSTQSLAVQGGTQAAGALQGGSADGGAAAAAGDAAGGVCCKQTLPEFLGVTGLFKAVGGIFKFVGNLPIVKSLTTGVLGPLAQVGGLAPSSAAGGFSGGGDGGAGGAGGGAPGIPGGPGGPPPGEAPGAADVAAKIDADKAKAAATIDAVRYLAKQDCNCYPEIVAALLSELDDCTEAVRYEILLALYGACNKAICEVFDQSGPFGGLQPVQSACGSKCPNCACQLNVIQRLSDLLLERDASGWPKERSQRVRRLAIYIIKSCLTRVGPKPRVPLPEPEPLPIPTPERAPETTKGAAFLNDANINSRAVNLARRLRMRESDLPQPSSLNQEIVPVQRRAPQESPVRVVLPGRTNGDRENRSRFSQGFNVAEPQTSIGTRNPFGGGHASPDLDWVPRNVPAKLRDAFNAAPIPSSRQFSPPVSVGRTSTFDRIEVNDGSTNSRTKRGAVQANHATIRTVRQPSKIQQMVYIEDEPPYGSLFSEDDPISPTVFDAGPPVDPPPPAPIEVSEPAPEVAAANELPGIDDDIPGFKLIPEEVFNRAVDAVATESYLTKRDIVNAGTRRVKYAPFEIDPAYPGNSVRLRLDLAYGYERPDRAEYFWAGSSAGGPILPETGVDYQQIRIATETGSETISALFEVPIIILDPEANDNTAGLGDLVIGAKTLMLKGNRYAVSSVFRTYLPTGLDRRGTGRGHTAMEAGILGSYQFGCNTVLHGELKFMWPIAADPDFSGEVLRSGLGLSHVLFSRPLHSGPGDKFAVISTLELVNWNLLDGRETLADGTLRGISGISVINLQPGLRFVLNDHMEFGAMWGGSITGDRLFRRMFRTELRFFY